MLLLQYYRRVVLLLQYYRLALLLLQYYGVAVLTVVTVSKASGAFVIE